MLSIIVRKGKNTYNSTNIKFKTQGKLKDKLRLCYQKELVRNWRKPGRGHEGTLRVHLQTPGKVPWRAVCHKGDL